MTVKELKEILNVVKDEDLKVAVGGYYTQEINGYYYDQKDGENVLLLTNHNVQPRVVS